MCYICVGSNKLFAFPGRTITASQADVNKATSYLHTLGFSGLKFEDHPEDNWIRLTFKDYNPIILDKTFGARKKASMGRVQWIIPGKGAVYVNEKRKRVLIQNIEQVEKKSPPRPLSPVDIPPYNPNVDTKTFADDKTIELYKRVQAAGSKSSNLDFMKRIWSYWNIHKFKGEMQIPNLGFLRDTGPGNLRKRGHWRGGVYRELMISPRLFNARFDVFAEVFLHEMCHQAVSEIDKVRETINKGHGPRWAAWMRKVGLEPNRYDKNDNIEYMTEDEKDAIEETKSKLTPIEYTRDSLRADYIPSAFLHPSKHELMNGVAFYSPRDPNRVAFINDMQLRKAALSGSFNWVLLNIGTPLYKRTAALPNGFDRTMEELMVRLGVGPKPAAGQSDTPAGMEEQHQRPYFSDPSPVPAAIMGVGGTPEDGFLFFDPTRPKQTSFISDNNLRVGAQGPNSFRWLNLAPSTKVYKRKTPATPEQSEALKTLRQRLEMNQEHKLARKAAKNRYGYKWRPY